jgi:hypothetical protein
MPSTKAPTTLDNGRFLNDFRDSPLEMVRTLFVRFIQGLFNASPVGAYHWESDRELSEIFISDENPVKTESCGTRPAISITRGPVQFYTLGLDDMQDYNAQTGKKTKGVLVPGTMTINCCSRVDLECDRLAWIVAEQLWMNREILMKAGFFEIGRMPTIGAPSPAGSIVVGDNADEFYVTSVTCPWQFARTSSATPLGAHIVRGINLAMRARSPIYDGENVGWPDTGTSELPTFTQGCSPPPFAPDASDVYGGTPNPGGKPNLLPVVPHPLNPAQMVTVRSSRPYGPAVKPPSIGGRTIPIVRYVVEESCGKQMDAQVTDTRLVKV